MKIIYVVAIVAGALSLLNTLTYGQSPPYASWSTKLERVSAVEVKLMVSAVVMPGWHLYSQFLSEGGPQPTRIAIVPDKKFQLSAFKEIGMPYTYYDSIYDMDVTWYSGEIDFVASIQLAEPVVIVNGVVEYMVCNAHLCVPARWSFHIPVDLTKTKS